MQKKANRAQTIFQLARNDIKARYSNSMLGIVWAFAMPLITILVFWYVFQVGFKNQPVEDVPYILWFSAAYVPWIFFTDTTTSGLGSLAEYSFLVKKMKFNIFCIPVIKMISAMFIHIFFLVFLLGMSLFYGYGLSVYSLQLIYYSLSGAVLGLGMVWLLSAVNVFLKDMNSLYNIVVQIGFWITPILWNEDSMAEVSVKKILSVNPMHYIINGFRDSLLFQCWFWQKPGETLLFWAITAAFWAVGLFVFKRLCPYFADEV